MMSFPTSVVENHMQIQSLFQYVNKLSHEQAKLQNEVHMLIAELSNLKNNYRHKPKDVKEQTGFKPDEIPTKEILIGHISKGLQALLSTIIDQENSNFPNLKELR